MEKDGITFDYIKSYLHSVRRDRTGQLGKKELEWRSEGLPIAEPEVADLIEILCFLKKPKKILEIGTCVGFSSLLMLSCCQDAKIYTIERNPAMLVRAEKHFNDFNANGNINQLVGDAANILPTLEPFYDMIFLDAAKGQYPAYYPEIKRLLSSGGVLICDNVLFNGYVAKGTPDRHRNKTIVVRLDEFLHILENDKEMKSVILPISDGTTVSIKTV